MVAQPLNRSNVARDGAGIREYVSLFLLLLASRLLGELVATGTETMRDTMTDALAPQLVGAIVYAALALTALAAVYAVHRRLRANDPAPERHELFTIAGTTAMLLLFGAYLLHGAADLPAFPGDVVGSLLAGSATAGVALVYVGYRGLDLRIGAPDAPSVAVATVLVSALAGLGWIVALEVGGNPVFRPTFVGVFAPEPRLSIGGLLLNAVLPNLFVGVGMGILYSGAVQESVREFSGPAGAAAAVTALVGVTAWGSGELSRTVETPPSVVSAVGVVLLAVLAAALVVRGVRLLERTLDADATPAAAASASALVVAGALVGVSALRSYPPGIVAGSVGFAVVGAAVSVGYERSRSVWVPALGLAAYLIVVDPDLALHVSRVFL